MLLLAVAGAAHGLTVTPIGPFCPFRSAACAENGPLGQAMGTLTQTKMPRFAAEMSRIQLEMQTGGAPDPSRVRVLADDLLEAEQEWRVMLTRMKMATDFQSREYFKMTSVWAERQGENLESIGIMMRWQAENMRAFANNEPPRPPPPGIDHAKLAEQQQRSGQQSMMAQISAASAVDSSPFTGNEAAFESPVVREEYEKLCRDHAGMIKLGESFGTFDAAGKIAFLDALEAVEERWDTFFARFALLGAINPDFEQQTSNFLESMGMPAGTFREVLAEAHSEMKREAEAAALAGA